MIVSQNPKIIFIHIPRTGGTSLRQIFGFPLVGHQTKAVILRNKIGQEEWNSHYKFSIVRNPWDRTVSSYLFLKDDVIGKNYKFPGGLAPNETFKEWVRRKMITVPFMGNFYSKSWLGDESGVIVDDILKFENYEQDVRAMLAKFGLEPDVMPHLNKSNRLHYSEYYDDITKEIVRQNFAHDIELFQYEF